MKARGVRCMKKPEPKDFFSCIRDPLIKGCDEKSIFDVCPLPELHLMTGITNHIWNALDERWGENRAYEWAKQHGIKNDSHHGNRFKGPSTRKILKIAHLFVVDRSLPRNLACFAYTLVAFDIVVSGCFGKTLSPSYEKDIDDFEKSYMKLGISITPKAHAVFAHLAEFINLGKGPLGFCSEQSIEASHYELLPFLANYPLNPTKPEQVGKQRYRAILKVNALHMQAAKNPG